MQFRTTIMLDDAFKTILVLLVSLRKIKCCSQTTKVSIFDSILKLFFTSKNALKFNLKVIKFSMF